MLPEMIRHFDKCEYFNAVETVGCLNFFFFKHLNKFGWFLTDRFINLNILVILFF